MARLCRMTAVYGGGFRLVFRPRKTGPQSPPSLDRKSTRLNSSHVEISYAVFCLKKKKALHVGLRVDQVAQVLADRGVVLGDEHSGLCHADDYPSGRPRNKVPFGH